MLLARLPRPRLPRCTGCDMGGRSSGRSQGEMLSFHTCREIENSKHCTRERGEAGSKAGGQVARGQGRSLQGPLGENEIQALISARTLGLSITHSYRPCGMVDASGTVPVTQGRPRLHSVDTHQRLIVRGLRPPHALKPFHTCSTLSGSGRSATSPSSRLRFAATLSGGCRMFCS